MDELEIKAYAKVNLALDVVRRLDNGYHQVRMVMQTVGICDVLTLQKQPEGITVRTDSGELPTDEHNLIYKAARIMREQYGIREGISVYLRKNIPIAAGMAGGSTDAASTFLGMNRLFGIHAGEEELRTLGVKVGADVPYCIMGGTVLAEGIGEILTPLPNMPDCYMVVAKPDLHVSTKYVYENLHADTLPSHPDIDGMIGAITKGDMGRITGLLSNVLETVTAVRYPVIEQIKEHLREHGACNALMSGSGPTVFGIFTEADTAARAYEDLKRAGLAGQVYATRPVFPVKEDT